MSYKATVKFSYSSDSEEPASKYFPESINCKTITVEAPAEGLNVYQYYELFKSFLAAAGFCEYSIMDGACRVAFNDSNSQEQMKKVADEYDLILAEDYHKKLVEYDTQQDEEIKKLEAEIRELKAKLADILPEQYDSGVTTSLGIGASRLRDYPRYDGSEWDTTPPYKSWGKLVPGSPEAVANSCKCPILDNEEMPDDKKWVNENCPLHGTRTSQSP
jgi:hypothetical protein